MKCPSELKNLYQEGRVLPFLGAGVSMSFQWKSAGKDIRGPSWSQLVDQAARELGFADPDLLRARGTDLQILEYYKIKQHGSFGKLTNWLVGALRPTDDELRGSALHCELAKLTKCGVYYTTNYDDFVERSLELAGRKAQAVALEGQIVNTSDVVEVVKFHGDWNYPDKMVWSESDFEKRRSFKSEMDYRFRSDALNRSILFIGYSFTDYNVPYLFRLVNEEFGRLPLSDGVRAYITVADPSEFEYRLFQARGMSVLAVDGANRTSEIAEILESMRS